jgi:hypothetical protein
MPRSSQFQPELCFDKTLTILDGETASDKIDLVGTYVVAMILPTGFDGAAFQLKASDALDGTFYNVKNTAGNLVAPVVGAEAYVAFEPSDMASIRFLQVVADTSQTGDVTIKLATRPLS